MPREVIISLAFVAVLLGAVAWFFWPQVGPGHSHYLGQELLQAAEDRDWSRAKVLLDEGADPDVTELDPSMLYHASPFTLHGLELRFLMPHPTSSSALKRPPALALAAEQGNLEAVKMLLAHHATITGDVRNMVTCCGDRELIRYLEDAGGIPLNKRSVSTAPFTAAAGSPRENVMASVGGAGPLNHYLWLSPHELLLERGGAAPSLTWSHGPHPTVMPEPTPGTPPSFFAFDLNTQDETELPDLTKAWTDQPEFDPGMLALSPDGQWLLGFGGTKEHPTWRATQVHGSGVQEWDRVAERDPKKRFWLGSHPLIAWRDNTRWLEVNQAGPGYAVRLRTLGMAETQELPIARGYGISTSDAAEFTCSDPDHALVVGGVGVTNSRQGGPQYVLEWTGLTAGPNAWASEKRGFNVSSADQPGWTLRCVPSPDGKRLAWLQLFANGLARDIILSDADGSHFRIVREWLSSSRDLPVKRRDFPNYRSLDWTADGTKLIYWRGEKGEEGLCLLPIGAEE